MAKKHRVVVYLSDNEYELLLQEHARQVAWNRELDTRDGLKLPVPSVNDCAYGVLATSLCDQAERAGRL